MITCRNGQHSLQVIYIAGSSDCVDVVRWCRECGAVVVDVDFDNRTQPGRAVPMQFPAYLSRLPQDPS